MTNAWPDPILAVALDMDGLMINTEDMYTEISQVLLERRGRSFSLELKRAMMGKPAPQAWAIMIAAHDLTDDWETLQAETDVLFESLLPERIAPMPGLMSLLERLDQLQLPRCVATSSHRAFAEEALGLCQLVDRVDFILTARDVAQGKPAPDIYLASAAKMKVEPRQMLVLEDSMTGMEAGLAANACVVAVPNPCFANIPLPQVFTRCDRLDHPDILKLLQPH